ncbi:MAG: endonuclease/exonuclease/phosphatase family protein [Limisphaerales bacterium]
MNAVTQFTGKRSAARARGAGTQPAVSRVCSLGAPQLPWISLFRPPHSGSRPAIRQVAVGRHARGLLFWLLVGFARPAAAWSLLTWNLSGNGAADWSTNSPQVQAIGRVLRHLDPDVATFQEVPFQFRDRMPAIVRAWLPGHSYVQNSGTDGVLMSGIASRFPVRRSQKWLDGADLAPFGGSGRFTRDLFEAELAVPDYLAPVHVFTTHLKSGQLGASPTNRFFEALAVSNFFVNTFPAAQRARGHVLTGDFNEDHASPPLPRMSAVMALTNGSGLRMTLPRNPGTGREWTLSIRDRLDRRYDYVLPGGLLSSNLAAGLVFRSDTLFPRPPGMERTDSATASDHLPVMLWFGHPDEELFAVQAKSLAAGSISLTWPARVGRRYEISAVVRPGAWQAVETVLAESVNPVWSAPADGMTRWFRLRTAP